MTGLVRQWLLGVTAAALVLALADVLARRAARKRFAGWRAAWSFCWRRWGR